jgi:stage II sporulation protein D
MPGGGVQGLALVLDESAPRARALVVVAPGGSGRDAATIAAAILTRPQAERAGASRAAVRLGVTRSGGVEAREVPLEDYVAGVVAGEAPGEGLDAVQRAMAIAARTVVEGRRGRHSREGFDVCDTTHCQVVRAATPASRAAAEQTAGLVLSWEGRVAEIYYAASCGGTLADPGHVWPGRRVAWPPYLSARTDPAGDGLHEVRWQADLPVSIAVQALRASGLRGDRLDAFSVRARDAQGRASFLHAAGFTPDTVSAETFRMAAGRVAGWGLVKSTWFNLVRTAAGYQLSGRGLGHGVGLCVRGAAAMAAAGRTTEELLEAYFPGTALRPAGDVAQASLTPVFRVVLSSSDERHRPAIEAEARRFVQQLSGRLLLTAPRAITLRFHPTVSSYQRATGQPWWTSATTTGTRVDLLPASTLEARQRLVPTLRHEIVHVVTAEALEGKPRWVQEGVARYYTWTGEARHAPPDRTSRPCPDDAAFADARSGDVLELLYERSSACVIRALESGRTWRDLP